MDFEKQQNKETGNQAAVSIENIGKEKISEFKSDSNFVVREIRLVELENEYRGKLNRDYSAIELAELGKELFAELQDKYGINVPAKFFLSKDSEQSLFSIVDKIEPVVPTQEENEMIAQKFYQLYESLSQYYLDKLRTHEAFLTDVNGITQYVYGMSFAKSNEAKIYLVDTDIYLDDRTESLLTVVYWLARHVSGIEKDTQMIRTIRTFIDEYEKSFIQIDDKNIKRLEQLRKFLLGQYFDDEILPAIPTFEKK